MKKELEEVNEALNSIISRFKNGLTKLSDFTYQKLKQDKKKSRIILTINIAIISSFIVLLLNIYSYISNDFVVVESEKYTESNSIAIPANPSDTKRKQKDIYRSIKELQKSDQNSKKAINKYNVLIKKINSLSYYNLGVSKLKSGKYEEALNMFKKSLQTEQYKFVSAINAAVTAKHMGNQKLFNYYLGLASIYILDITSDPNFKYYYGILNYYKGNYIATIASLKNNKAFKSYSDRMLFKSYLAFEDYYHAVDLIPLKIKNSKLNTGILYSKIGEYDLAIKDLKEALNNKEQSKIAKNILLSVYIKNKNYSQLLPLVTKMSDDEIKNFKESLNVELVVNGNLNNNYYNYEKLKNILDNKSFRIQFMGYYTPYMLLDLLNLPASINKINSNLKQDIKDRYLKNTLNQTNKNIEIQKALNMIRDRRLITAERMLKEQYKKDKKNSLINYNLGLLNLNLMHFMESFKHFLISYQNNRRNIVAGIYAKLLGDYLRRDTKILTKLLIQNIEENVKDPSLELYYISFLNMNNTTYNAQKWLNLKKKNSVESLALDVILGHKSDLDNTLKKLNLLKLRKNNTLAILIEDILKNSKYNYVEFVKKSIDTINRSSITIEKIYTSSFAVKRLFVIYSVVTLKINELTKILENKFRSANKYFLSLAKFYSYILILDNQNGRIAKDIYNDLLNKYKMYDIHTMTKAVLINVKYKNYSDAVILLRIILNKDSKNQEALYALGMISLQQGKLTQALQYLKRIDDGFTSRNFDFKIIN